MHAIQNPFRKLAFCVNEIALHQGKKIGERNGFLFILFNEYFDTFLPLYSYVLLKLKNAHTVTITLIELFLFVIMGSVLKLFLLDCTLYVVVAHFVCVFSSNFFCFRLKLKKERIHPAVNSTNILTLAVCAWKTGKLYCILIIWNRLRSIKHVKIIVWYDILWFPVLFHLYTSVKLHCGAICRQWHHTVSTIEFWIFSIAETFFVVIVFVVVRLFLSPFSNRIALIKL